MKKSAKDILLSSFELIVKKPILFAPFLVLAFFEGIVLELIYFSSRKPLAHIASPIISKFFGDRFIHYPGSLVVLPKLFYFAQLLVYVFIGVLLFAIAVNMVKNITSKLPIKTNALIKNASKRYVSFVLYGFLTAFLILLLTKFNGFLLSKVYALLSQQYPNATRTLTFYLTPPFFFITTVIVQVFMMMLIPAIVIGEKGFLKALLASLSSGLRNFLPLFVIVFVPYLLYFPISLLKGFSVKLISMSFSEVTLIIAIIGIILSIPVNCFLMVCASNFYLDRMSK